jgi:hypothetical protein
MYPDSSSEHPETILPEFYPTPKARYTQGFPIDDDDPIEPAASSVSLATRYSLPQRVLDLVIERRGFQHGPKRIVTAVRHLLMRVMHPIHREMYCSPIVSIRKNAKLFRAIYANKVLASQIHQAAYDGDKPAHVRLKEIADLILARLGHILGLLKPVKKDLHDRLVGIVAVSIPA